MDLRNLNTFIQVAELSSFSRAGEKLGYSQPTISFQIKQLETELGCKLFDRIGHTVRLTDKGRDILSYAQKICHLTQEMTLGDDAQSETPTIIRLAMADSLCNPLISRGFASFREKHPHISLKVTTCGTTELFQLLDQNEVDMVCTLDNHIYDTNYIIANEEKIGVHFVAAKGSPLCIASELSIQELIAQPFLLTEKGMSYRRLLDEKLAKDSMEIHPILEIGSADLICKLVEDGVGISFLPDYVTEAAIQRGTIVRLNVKDFEVELWKQLLYHRDKWVSPQMEATIGQFGMILLN
ncbi:MAG: LysR family transcriptional regulator [Lachnospiraceae bacterium]|nr:LysR family transcriptional regulator [Lachnospiraceae bacterium]